MTQWNSTPWPAKRSWRPRLNATQDSSTTSAGRTQKRSTILVSGWAEEEKPKEAPLGEQELPLSSNSLQGLALLSRSFLGGAPRAIV